MKQLSSLSVVLPAFNDEHTIKPIVKNVFMVAPKLTNDYEVIVVNDASTDSTGEALAKLKKKYPRLKVITHSQNRDYGGALISGFSKASKELIFYTDSDGQYDVNDLASLVAVFDKDTDMVTGFKLIRSDSWFRKIVGVVYNQFVKIMFQLPVRDVDCDFRLFRRRILDLATLTTTSGGFDVEFLSQLKKKNACIKEVGVYHYPRKYGQSQFFSAARIIRSLWDVAVLWLRQARGDL